MPDCHKPTWKIELFGGLRVSSGSNTLTHFRTHKTAALLAYLAYHPTLHPRERLAYAFWPDVPPGVARRSLNMAVCSLQQQLTNLSGDKACALLSEWTTLQIDGDLVVTDVAQFESAYREALSSTGPGGREERLLTAVELYRGELLPGFYDEWVMPEQNRLAELFGRCVFMISELMERSGNLQPAIDLVWRALQGSPADEELNVRIMQLYCRAGQPESAIHRYRELERILVKERKKSLSLAARHCFAEASRMSREQAITGSHAVTRVETRQRLSPAAAIGDAVLLATTSHPQRVGVLFWQGVDQDLAAARMLAERLQCAGHLVFTSEHGGFTVSFARWLERQIRTADTIVVLLSERSASSELLQYQLSVVQEEAAQSGKPRIIPVVHQGTPLPVEMQRYIYPYRGIAWDGQRESLATSIAAELDGQCGARPAAVPSITASAPDYRSSRYITRTADETFRSAIVRGDAIVLVKGPRRAGKTSLIASGARQCQAYGGLAVITDIRSLPAPDLESCGSLFLACAESIASQLDLDLEMDEFASSKRSPSRSFERLLRRQVLPAMSRPLLWVMENADRLFGRPIASETFGLFRSWHNERAFRPDSHRVSLTVVLSYSTEARLFITDENVSPFNVGTEVNLESFSEDEMAELNRYWGSPLQTAADLRLFHRFFGGQPYLSQLGLDIMATRGCTMDRLVREAPSEPAIADHLQSVLSGIAKSSVLREAVYAVLRQEPCPSVELFYRLRSAGLVVGPTAGAARIACQVYQDFLEASFS